MWHAPVCESFDLGARQRCSRVATFLALQLAVQVKAGGHAEALSLKAVLRQRPPRPRTACGCKKDETLKLLNPKSRKGTKMAKQRAVSAPPSIVVGIVPDKLDGHDAKSEAQPGEERLLASCFSPQNRGPPPHQVEEHLLKELKERSRTILTRRWEDAKRSMNR